ncbi:hypothetical protein [Streptomyces sp. NPDC055036]
MLPAPPAQCRAAEETAATKDGAWRSGGSGEPTGFCTSWMPLRTRSSVGGGIGAAGVLANLSLARRRLAVPLKVLAMVGVVLAAYLVYFALV